MQKTTNTVNTKNTRASISFSDAAKASGSPSKNIIQKTKNASGKTSPSAMAVRIPLLSSHSKDIPSSSALMTAADLLKFKEDMKKEILEQLRNEDSGSESNFDTRVNCVLDNSFYPLDFEDDIEEFVPEAKEQAINENNKGFVSVRKRK